VAEAAELRQAARERAREDELARRLAEATPRALPNFVIIGTQRGGTTSLFRYLGDHPEVGPTLRKEIHYFDLNFDRGPAWYLAHFPEQGRYRAVGEASPYYIVHPQAPARLRELVPGATIVALLRNPIDRALSHHQMMVRRGVETLSFGDAVAREPSRLAASSGADDPTWRAYSYLARGVYAPQIERWLALFPRENVLVVRSEDFFRDPGPTVAEIQDRLGLGRKLPASPKAYHLADYAGMSPALRRRLREYFAPHNRHLYELIGRDFGWDHDER
jgi:hypothetical protein